MCYYLAGFFLSLDHLSFYISWIFTIASEVSATVYWSFVEVLVCDDAHGFWTFFLMQISELVIARKSEGVRSVNDACALILKPGDWPCTNFKILI